MNLNVLTAVLFEVSLPPEDLIKQFKKKIKLKKGQSFKTETAFTAEKLSKPILKFG